MAFAGLNTTQALPAGDARAFPVVAAAGTDLWRKPPGVDSFNAPMIYKAVALGKFKRARISFAADYATQYDQGGMVFVLPAERSDVNPKFVKVGVEFFQGQPRRSAVAVDTWADWTLGPSIYQKDGGSEKKKVTTTVELEREEEAGSSLWVYAVEEDGKVRHPFREITWVFRDVKPDAMCWVGAFAAKPNQGPDFTLEVKDFEIETMP